MSSTTSKYFDKFSGLLKDVQKEAEEAKNLDQLCDELCKILINEKCSYDESLCSQSFAIAVWSVVVEAARRCVAPSILRDILPSGKLSGAVIVSYEKCYDILRAQLKTVGWEYPQIVGMDWKLSQIPRHDGKEHSETITEICFDTVQCGSVNIDSFSFYCTPDDLQDILGKLKETQNAVMNLRKFERRP
ncbi:hypothetical protein AB6A40_001314 [Gnathostoma spinigerum]|uniref:COMM domain-containing protein 3 n=1 Tax=Gnathostoma spinigerum TaxID=75299 RepID=A0ABD6E4W3_9BILA